MEEITSRYVEIELDCENGGLWYRVITYYKDGSSATDVKCVRNVKENVGDILQILGSNDLEFIIKDILVKGDRGLL